jgi:AbrB family looped-hinge helix DNA binding protein
MDFLESANATIIWQLPCYNTIMSTKHTVGIDKAGRIVLPKPLRDELQLEPGVTLEIESSGEELTLRPVRGQFPLRKKQGVWVFRSGEPLSGDEVEKTLRKVREERHQHTLGEDE